MRTVEAHYADRVLMSVKGLTAGGVMTDADPLEAEVKRAMIAQSGMSVLLVDDSKLTIRGLSVIAPASDVTTVLAVGLSAEQAAGLRASGATVELLEVPGAAAAADRDDVACSPTTGGPAASASSTTASRSASASAGRGSPGRSAPTVPGWRQAAYEIEVDDAAAGAWRPAASTSDESVLVPWAAPPLASRERRAVRVRVWGAGRAGRRRGAEPAVVEAGLLDPADWTAQLVAPAGDDERPVDGPARLLRREFDAARPVARGAAVRDRPRRLRGRAQRRARRRPRARARLDELRSPAALPDLRRDRAAARRRATRIGAMLGDGWFRGRLGFGGGRRNIYGDRLALLAQLEIALRRRHAPSAS